MPLSEDQYTLGDDGLVVEKVGAWARRKHKLLADYIQASRGARSKYHVRSGAAYIDVFCGPGRLVVRGTTDYIDGSPIAAFRQGKDSGVPFSSIEISDLQTELLSAAQTRLQNLDAPVRPATGPALRAMAEIVERVHLHGLHFAFLDPHNLGALSFKLFETLARLKHVDVLVHISIADLQRNVDLFTTGQFDDFAPAVPNRCSFRRSAAQSAPGDRGSRSIVLGVRLSVKLIFARSIGIATRRSRRSSRSPHANGARRTLRSRSSSACVDGVFTSDSKRRSPGHREARQARDRERSFRSREEAVSASAPH
jgi:hypothetical protein